MRKLIAAAVSALAVSAAFSASAAVEKFAKFEEFKPGDVKPLGFLKEFLERQRDGLSGHPGKLKYPYDTGLWEGPIPEVHFTEGIHHGSDMPVPDASGSWWPYEQAAYYLDATVRLSYLVDEPKFVEKFKRSLDYLVSHPDGKGRLGRTLHSTGSEWPMVVFFRAVMAYVDATGDDSVLKDAFAKHYAGHSGARVKWGGRDLLNVEGMLRVYEATGDESLLTDSVTSVTNGGDFKSFRDKPRIVNHGVSYSEALKLPALLHKYTGDGSFLAVGKKAVDDAFREHGQPSGQISCNEYTSGRDPRQGYESCVEADMTWTLGYYIEADGETRFADRMERIAYNALPGAITKDFRRHQYLSAVNQMVATPFCNSSHFNYGEATWRAYQPCHFPQCCSGNIQRTMPAFVQRMWLRDAKSGAPCAMLYGPSSVKGVYGGKKYVLSAETSYPFEDEIRVTYTGEEMEMPVTFRIPGWCDGATVETGAGEEVLRPKGGELLVVRRRWKSGDTVRLYFPAKIVVESDRNWHWVRRGPLTFSYPIPMDIAAECPDDPFSPLSITPAGPWNYAFDMATIDPSKFTLVRHESAYPFDTPPVGIRVPVSEIKGWDTLKANRYTPDVPLYVSPSGAKREIELVPFGATLLRLTAFPDTNRRRMCPVVAAYVSDIYDYNPWRPLAEQRHEPETKPWTDMDFRRRPIVQRTPEDFFDLCGHFQTKAENKLAYLMFRFWSDEDATATFSLGAANAYEAFIDGERVASSGDWSWYEGEMMSGEWFRHKVRKGYNYLLVKCGIPPKWAVGQYRREWGAKLDVFIDSAPAASARTHAEKTRLLRSADRGYVFVATHRASWRDAPENSIPAIEAAIEMGADMTEVDVKETKDGVLVVSHDDTVDRCSNGKGRISDKTLAELKSLRLKEGQGGKDARLTDETYPTLEEALAVTKGRIMVNLDQCWGRNGAMIELCRRLGIENEVILKGGFTPQLAECYDVGAKEWHSVTNGEFLYMPILNVGWTNAVPFMADWRKHPAVTMFEVCVPADMELPDGLNPARYSAVPAPRLWLNTLWASLCGGHDEVTAGGDPEKCWRWALDQGATVIQTDDPRRLIKWLESEGRR